MRKFLFFGLIFLTFSQISAQQPIARQAFFLTSLLPDSVQLNGAKGLSVDLSGDIYVADTGNNRILKISPSGEIINVVGGFGWDAEQFYTPLDICTGSALDVFVADYNNNRIQRYDKDLNYISSLNSDENWDESYRFGYPKSIDVSIHGELFILDRENVRILKLNSFGEPELSFGDYSEGKGQLLDPVQLTISPQDVIYVSDRQANKILVFDYFGNYISEIGGSILKEPQGISFSDRKLLFVADTGNKRIAVFNPAGELIYQWSQISPSEGTFQNPVDVVSFEKKVFVLDDDRIFVFELKGK